MQANPVVWFEIYVQDMDRARAFYETVFDCRLEALGAPDGEAGGMQTPCRSCHVGLRKFAPD